MTQSALLFIFMAALIVAIVLLVVLVRRRPAAALEAHRVALEQALRTELRDGRAELRQQL
ncbi:MAG: hypothetical protein JWL98_291, partial [Xanthomonadaceae bacterium]|nr:hypothetical protein [Xanthomonadaceae bacterium]